LSQGHKKKARFHAKPQRRVGGGIIEVNVTGNELAKEIVDSAYRADLMVEELVIVEIKSVEVVAPVRKKQLLTHLRLAHKRLGLLINFNVALIKDGITRVAMPTDSPSSLLCGFSLRLCGFA
jgi:hypothetical protein